MHDGRIPVAEYREFARRFNPVKYDPDAWVRLARDAGMKYIVITSKHHDGFALFETRASKWNVVDSTPYGKDLLKPLAEACRRHGIRLGFYYSQAQDWNNPGGASYGPHWDKAQDGDMDAYLREVAARQVREILTGYGPLAILWWDTPVNMTRERADLLLPLLALQPGIIHNNRLGGGYNGDTETPEQVIPPTGFPGRDWETCMTMNDTWGYKSYDQNWKSTEVLVRNLVDIASKGGNYLLNVGPTSEGLIPGPSVERLKAVGRWMKVNREAIYSTSASPFKRLPWGRCTKKTEGAETTLFLHVFDWPTDQKLVVPGLKNKPQRVYLLADKSRKPLETTCGAESLTITLPAQAPDPISSTLVLKVKGPLEIEQPGLQQSADGSILLTASEARTHGDQIRYESGHQRDNIGFWLNPEDWADWDIAVRRPGNFELAVDIAGPAATSIQIVAGTQKVVGKLPATGDYGKFQEVSLGRISIASSGRNTVKLQAVKDGWNAVNVKAIKLKPVQP
jgi:alpha-L-fucosidase